MATTERDDLYKQLVEIAALALVKLIQSPEGAVQCAAHLRDQGWTCTPPATKAVAKLPQAPAPARRKGRG